MICRSLLLPKKVNQRGCFFLTRMGGRWLHLLFLDPSDPCLRAFSRSALLRAFPTYTVFDPKVNGDSVITENNTKI